MAVDAQRKRDGRVPTRGPEKDPGVGPALASIEAAHDALGASLRAVSPGAISGEGARRLVDALAGLERVCASAIARFAPRVLETGAYAKEGYASGPDWLGAVSGSSAGAARGRLVAAEQAAAVPELDEALRQGTLSAPELSVLAAGASADPNAAAELVELAQGPASHQELSAAAADVRAAARQAECERARRERVQRERHLRWRQLPTGGVRGEFLCDEVAWSRVAPGLEAAAKARAAGAGAGAEPFEAHRLDAFLEALEGPGTGRARPRVLIHVDADALRRGTTRTGEICEIAGIGPVSLHAIGELLGEGAALYVLKEGADIKNVTKASRDLAQRTADALLARDRFCVVPGCGKRLGLEEDHCRVDYAAGGPTTLDNLARLCGPHHAMKTHGGWSLGGGPGDWSWIPPPEPPSAGAIARARKVAAARARRE